MRIRPAHLILAAFGVLLVGVLFVLFSARSAQAVELGPSGSVAPGIVTEPVTAVATDPLAPPPADLSGAPIVATSTALVPTETPVVGAATDSAQTLIGAPSGLVDPSLSQVTDTAGRVVDSATALPVVNDTLAPIASALDGVTQDVGAGTPVEPLLDQFTPAPAVPAATGPGLGHSFVLSSDIIVRPPTALGLSAIVQRSLLAAFQSSDGTGVRTFALDGRSSGSEDASAAPTPAMPRTSDPPGWEGFVASLVGASAQGAERAGSGFVFAVLIAAVGLLAGRRRFMLIAQAVQAQRFVSVIVRPG